MNTNYLLQLSPIEIHWLASAFGNMRLSLLDDPLRQTPNSQLAAELKGGMEALESRGIISRVSSGWQVDRLSAAVISWLGTADSALLIDHHTHDGLSRRSQVFSRGEVFMHVVLEDGTYHFLFLSGIEALSDHLLDHIDESLPESESAPSKYEISQPVTIISTAWTNTTLATNMLRVTGCNPKQIKPVLAWAVSLDWVIRLKPVPLGDEKTEDREQMIMCGNNNGLWGGAATIRDEDPVTLVSVRKEKIRDLIKDLL